MRHFPAILILLVLAGCDGSQKPSPETAETTPPETPWFTDVTEKAGLDFIHAAGYRGDFHMPEIMGAGGAFFDYDGDGDLDVYLVNGGAPDGGAPNRMFRQEAGGGFTDVTGASGLGDDGYGMGAALGDVDNDGDLDLFVSNYGPDVLYLADGGGTFRAVEPSAGMGDDIWSTSSCFLDYDGDGFLDLYVATYVAFDPPKACTDKSSHRDFCGPDSFRGVPDRLYRGRGDGTFTDVSAVALPSRPANKGLGVVCADLDGDARTDVYVANDGEQNQLWLRRAGGGDVFEDRAPLLGAALNIFSKPEASMGVAVGDTDGDLDLDLFVTHLDRETNTLYQHLGPAGFEDRTAASGLGPAGLAYTGFGTALLDADLDGDLDLAVVNGGVRRSPSVLERMERRRARPDAEDVPPLLQDYAEPNQLFLNDGGGRFAEAAGPAGPLASAVGVSRSLWAADFDGDGDLDLLLSNCGGRARLYRNDAPRAGHWLGIRVVDPALRRDALGAAAIVEAGGRSFLRPVLSTFGYLSAVEPELRFGLGGAERFDKVTVAWTDGTREEFPGTGADRVIELLKGEGSRL